MENIHEQTFQITQFDREKKKKIKSILIWFTGLSGSGKSTLANELEKYLFKNNIDSYILDGDNMRKGLNSDLGFSDMDRKENIRRIGEVANLFLDAGIVCLAAFISPFERDREMIRNIIGDERFIEVYVCTPLEVCEQRDVKGLYKKARKGKLLNFTGISSPFEAPSNPSISIDTSNGSVEESIGKLVQLIEKKIKL